MNDRMERARKVGAWIWQRVSAAVALVLILLALIVGYGLGKPDVDSEVASDAETSSGPGEVQMYTCAMHPSVRLPDASAKCPICFMELIPVSMDDGGEGDERRIALSESAVKLSQIETVEVGQFFPRSEVRLFGKVTYDETSVARLTAYFPGRVERLFVNYVGVPVQKGDHLAEVYSPELLTAFEELRQAHSALAGSDEASELIRGMTREILEAAREKLQLYGLTAAQIESAESGELKQDRLTIYAPIGGIVTHVKVREGDYMKTGSPIATVADLSRLWVDLEAYESQLPLLRWGQEVTFSVEAHPGESFDGNIAFIEPLVDEKTRTVAVRVAVGNSDGRLKPGMFATAVVRPRIAAGGVVVSDELAGRWVSPMHPTIVKDGPGSCDVCGMELVTAESLGVVGDSSALEAPLVIPRTAVLFTGVRSVVYVRVPGREKPTYEGREVHLGARAGDFYTIRSGLSVGEEVVVKGAFRIDSAMQIIAKPSMMMPQGGGGTGHQHDHGSRGMSKEKTTQAPPEEFLSGLKPVYAAYLDAQEALASDDLGAFAQAVDDLGTALRELNEGGLVGEDLGVFRRAAAGLRQKAPITTIDVARARFQAMSAGVIELERSFGHRGSQTWRVAYCPMAFDSKGAEWLQRGEEIANPYFGASMLRCGEFREEFAPADGNGHETHKGHDPGKADE